MTIKTPEQIIHDVTEARAAEMNTDERMYFPEDLAARVAWFDTEGDPLSFVIQAILADRAQRTEHPEPVESAFQVGDLVRLTGKDWTGDMSGAEVVITGHDQDGDPQFMFDGEGPYSIWDAGTYLGDFTATLVRRAGER